MSSFELEGMVPEGGVDSGEAGLEPGGVPEGERGGTSRTSWLVLVTRCCNSRT